MSLTRRTTLAAPVLLLTPHAFGQAAFPTRAVRIVVPYTPGGVSDITARLIAEPMAARFGHPVPVENRPGADGIIGTDVVAKAPPDGHTLGLVSVAHSVNAAFYRLPFDTLRDFTFISMTTRTPLVLCAPKAFGPSTPAELVAYARANPKGHVTFAGTAGVVRLAPVLFAQRADVEFTYIPYRGSTQAHPDLIANRVNIMFDTVPAALPHIQSGALKALATTGAQRAPQLPDVPTIGEAFMPGFEASTWGIVIAPAGLPAPTVARLNEAVVAALKVQSVVDRHRTLGADIVTTSPEETARMVATELAKWGDAAAKAGIEKQNV
ncbi:Bug family tripartite tricarboxylate transporter substrate binding protein [Elioraea rosea]|uniref:Bug family tripartite tricarboxylate transporter substrate binding protein n=1 Tax=Elioraea rosea TaxID=2492390 RepID=UPI001183A017|nr:tripartite tricarboxylate transporter substrate binding protein [Elioraea rosea]